MKAVCEGLACRRAQRKASVATAQGRGARKNEEENTVLGWPFSATSLQMRTKELYSYHNQLTAVPHYTTRVA